MLTHNFPPHVVEQIAREAGLKDPDNFHLTHREVRERIAAGTANQELLEHVRKQHDQLRGLLSRVQPRLQELLSS